LGEVKGIGMPDKQIYRDAGELASLCARLRRERGPLVLANGCFDILHVGHVRYLCEAASWGGVLIVALNDDRSARALKGPGRPIMPEEERAEILCALKCVDFVLIFADSTVDGIMKIIRPDYHAKGTDYSVDTVPERETARSVGCRTIITGDTKEHSSRDIIGKIREGGECGS
jgi:D-glycero-beta-D-manno-heptose 1-phosphate adenylyltransferase